MNQLFKLKRASGKGEKAPHKPVLLLSIIKLIEDGVVDENKFTINPTLVFYFKETWSELVKSNHWKPQIFLPFFHLSNDKNVWELTLENGVDINLTSRYSPRSLGALVNSVAYAQLDNSLVADFFNPLYREILRTKLTQFYFPDIELSDSKNYKQKSIEYYNTLEREFFSPNVREDISVIDENDSIARSSLFKSKVPSLYHFTCAVTRLNITTNVNASMIDACHIEPWSINKNDSVKNGIALSPTIHRAFDKHLITIDEDYRVVVSDNFIENEKNEYGLRKLHGRKILLPEKPDYFPSQILLEAHRERFSA